MATLKTLVSFTGTNGSAPEAVLIVDSAGDLLGTTANGGTFGDGTVFEIAKSGAGYAKMPTTLVNFDIANGSLPSAGLIADAAGDLFGTTQNGGVSGHGTVFELNNHSGSFTLTTLVSFAGTNGANPTNAGLIVDPAGNLFGTTAAGPVQLGGGTVFEVVKAGSGYAHSPKVLVGFDDTDGFEPSAGLVADAAGNLFGTTYAGGADGAGTAFEIFKTGSGYATSPTMLVSFDGADGANPWAGMILDGAGDLFGTTYIGGSHGVGTVFEIPKIAGGYGTLVTLVSFNIADGAGPRANLIIDASGDLFGTTAGGGASGEGTVFKIAKTSSGYSSTPTTLVSFNSSINGDTPVAGLIADAAGDLFGTTSDGGPTGPDGTVFELTGSGFVVTPAPPSGVSISPMTASLAATQSGSGLAASAKLATVIQVGGHPGDGFSYNLGGSGASAFRLTTGNNVGTLSVGSSGVAGGANGKLYALMLTAIDITTGKSSPASPFNTVVSTGGTDIVSLAKLAGSLGTGTPTFIYGLAGNDAIDGTGMTSKLWFIGGQGADTMTGGSGVNDYLFGATSDSTPAATDSVTNFHVAKDLIDLTGIGGGALSYAGKIVATTLSSHSVGWQQSGGDTFVYANTSGLSESLMGTNMKIELKGALSLTSGNILHH